MKRTAKYKPLLFTTTVRSPERLKGFLGVLKKFDGQVLSDPLAKKIAGEIIRAGLYKPKNLRKLVEAKWKAKKPLGNREIAQILKENPQHHKEAGFSRGWPSRFDTWFKLAKVLGFVFYKSGKAIRFSEIGNELARTDASDEDASDADFEQQAFLNAFVKYQNNNPFRRVLNENAPLLLLLGVIQKLNSDMEFNGAGISKLELPLLLYWKDSNAEPLYQRIKKLRHEFGFDPSWDVVVAICREEIMAGKDIKRSNQSIMSDYPDDFIRKMRLTGLITLRGGGRFIDINKNEQKKVDYVLANYSAYKKYETEEDYFDYISTADDNLFSIAPTHVSEKNKAILLEKWVDFLGWDTIKEEMSILSRKVNAKDEILKYLSHPVRLEFLTALAIKSQLPNVRVIPNYPVDDEGIPTSTAPGTGNIGDIECFENANGILVEVTMSQGTTQYMTEVWPIARHLGKFKEKAANAMCYFVAPSIFCDTSQQIEFLKEKKNLRIFPKTIKEFLAYLEGIDRLYIAES
ncbi:MAG: AlwI family type II restriction endonuclease [Alphaproteobacteria bacterium]|nr:AlwI family type II restriction endonuclease [Alphaproteobacteria bacterium]